MVRFLKILVWKGPLFRELDQISHSDRKTNEPFTQTVRFNSANRLEKNRSKT